MGYCREFEYSLKMVGCRLKANCPLIHVGPGPTWSMPSEHLYASLEENHGKLRTARSTKATGIRTWHLPSSSFERYQPATGGATPKGRSCHRKFDCQRRWSLPRFVSLTICYRTGALDAAIDQRDQRSSHSRSIRRPVERCNPSKY